MAVYTQVDDSDLETLLDDYAVGRLRSFHGIAEGVENTNYLVETNQRRVILTLYEKRVAEADLPFFLNLLDHLAARGVPCPLPLHDHQGQAITTLAGRPAALFSFLDGIWPRRIEVAHCEAVGEALARLHLAGQDFAQHRANSLALPAWRTLFEHCRSGADQVQRGLADAVSQELAGLEATWPENLPTGVIHADLFPDNVFFQDGQVSGLIDFYFACNDALGYDVGICLNAWCFERDGCFNVTKAKALLSSYRRIRPVSAAEMQALPLLARGAAMRFLLTRLHDWLNGSSGPLVKPKDPLEYWHKLRFHHGVTGPEAYGLS